MARPREFDMDEATARAMALFWATGYEESSLADLLNHMGIARGSLYKAYGDKRSVWMAALDLYDRTVVQQAVTMLIDPDRGPGLTRVANFLGAPAAAIRDRDDQRGCFLCNAAVDRGPDDAEGHARVLSMFGRLEQGLRAAFADDADVRGWCAEDIDIKSQTTLAAYVGLRVLARAGRPVSSIETIASAHVESLLKG